MGIEFLFLQPNINLLLQNLNAKQGQFDNALYGILDTRSLIRDTLIIQQTTAAGLGTAVGSNIFLQPGNMKLIVAQAPQHPRPNPTRHCISHQRPDPGQFHCGSERMARP